MKGPIATNPSPTLLASQRTLLKKKTDNVRLKTFAFALSKAVSGKYLWIFPGH